MLICLRHVDVEHTRALISWVEKQGNRAPFTELKNEFHQLTNTQQALLLKGRDLSSQHRHTEECDRSPKVGIAEVLISLFKLMSSFSLTYKVKYVHILFNQF